MGARGRGKAATSEDYAVNRAIREIAQAHRLTSGALARLLYISPAATVMWMRKKPNRAPKAMLALLCYRLRIPQHELVRES